MNRDDIIRMAHEAGGYTTKHYPDEWRLDVDDLERFAALVAAAEREACAQVCVEQAKIVSNQANGKTVASHCAHYVRARGQE